MLAVPDSRKMVITRLPVGHDARAGGGADLGTVLVEVEVADPVQAVLDAPVAADDGRELGVAGLDDGERGDRVAGFARPFAFHLAAAHDLDGLGGVGESQPGLDGGDLEGAPLGAAVPAFPLVIGHRHVAPGKGGKLGIEVRLVALDDQQVLSAAPGQVGGMITLGMQRIGGDDGAGDVNAIQQRGNRGISLVLAPTSTCPSTTPCA